MDKRFKVVNIYRNYGPFLSFTVILFIIFQVLPESSNTITHPEIDSLIYTENLSPTSTHFLPFLCDVLPYHKSPIDATRAIPVYANGRFSGKYQINSMEIPNLKMPVPPQFVAKVHQKTRINMYPNSYNPFFFIIVSSNNIFLKIVFWRESLKKYSSLRPGDIIYVKDYKHKKKLPFIDKIEYNTFTESVYFDCEEITAKELVKIDLKITTATPGIFQSIEGHVSYLSVLLRYTCNSSLMEYVLCRIGEKSVILFYNSDEEFTNIKNGSKIRISEIRKAIRAGFEFYVSTIYTQFEILDETEKETSKEVEKETGAEIENVNEKETETDLDKQQENPMHDTLWSPSAKRYADYELESTKKVAIMNIFGAIGFLPDYFLCINEIMDYKANESVHGQDVSVNLFMKPAMSTIEELVKVNLVLNECKKHVVHSCILSVTEDDLTVDYIDHGVVKQQVSKKVILENNFECYLFQNFFSGLNSERSISEFITQKVYVVIESFRADADTILHYVTSVLDNEM